MRDHESEEIITTASGARASACEDYTGIPLSALDALARRHAIGAAKHGRDNYRKGMGDPEYVRARLSHIVRHALTLAAKLDGREPWSEDDDIGAILWGGMFLAEARATHPELFRSGLDPEDVWLSTWDAERGFLDALETLAGAIVGSAVPIAEAVPEAIRPHPANFDPALGSHEFHYDDKGVKAFRLDLVFGERYVRSIDGSEVEYRGRVAGGGGGAYRHRFIDLTDGAEFLRESSDIADIVPVA